MDSKIANTDSKIKNADVKIINADVIFINFYNTIIIMDAIFINMDCIITNSDRYKTRRSRAYIFVDLKLHFRFCYFYSRYLSILGTRCAKYRFYIFLDFGCCTN